MWFNRCQAVSSHAPLTLGRTHAALHDARTDSPSPGTFDLGHAVKRARGLVSGSKRYGIMLVLTFLGVLFAVGLLTLFLFPADLDELSAGPLWWEISAAAFTSGILAMLMAAFGLYRVSGRPLSYRALFDFMGSLWPYLVLSFPMALLTLVADESGSWLLRIAATIAVFPIPYAPYFMVDRGLGPLAALGQAYALVLSNALSFGLLVLLWVALTAVSVLTFGIALAWVMPFFMILNAVIYDQAVGIRGQYAD